jgi:hypothetical protein
MTDEAKKLKEILEFYKDRKGAPGGTAKPGSPVTVNLGRKGGIVRAIAGTPIEGGREVAVVHSDEGLLAIQQSRVDEELNVETVISEVWEEEPKEPKPKPKKGLKFTLLVGISTINDLGYEFNKSYENYFILAVNSSNVALFEDEDVVASGASIYDTVVPVEPILCPKLDIEKNKYSSTYLRLSGETYSHPLESIKSHYPFYDLESDEFYTKPLFEAVYKKQGNNELKTVINPNIEVKVSSVTEQDSWGLPTISDFISTTLSIHTFKQTFTILNGKTLVSKDIPFTYGHHRHTIEYFTASQLNTFFSRMPEIFRCLLLEGPINTLVYEGIITSKKSVYNVFSSYKESDLTSDVTIRQNIEVFSDINSPELRQTFVCLEDSLSEQVVYGYDDEKETVRSVLIDSKVQSNADIEIKASIDNSAVLSVSAIQEEIPNTGWVDVEIDLDLTGAGGDGDIVFWWSLVRGTIREDLRYIYGTYRYLWVYGFQGITTVGRYTVAVCSDFTLSSPSILFASNHPVRTVCPEDPDHHWSECVKAAFCCTSYDWPGIYLDGRDGGYFGDFVYGHLFPTDFLINVQYIDADSLQYGTGGGTGDDDDSDVEPLFRHVGDKYSCSFTSKCVYSINDIEIEPDRLLIPDYLDLDLPHCQNSLNSIKALKEDDSEVNSVFINLRTPVEKLFNVFPCKDWENPNIGQILNGKSALISGELIESKELISFKGTIQTASLVITSLGQEFTWLDPEENVKTGSGYIDLSVSVDKDNIYDVQQYSDSLVFFNSVLFACNTGTTLQAPAGPSHNGEYLSNNNNLWTFIKGYIPTWFDADGEFSKSYDFPEGNPYSSNLQSKTYSVSGKPGIDHKGVTLHNFKFFEDRGIECYHNGDLYVFKKFHGNYDTTTQKNTINSIFERGLMVAYKFKIDLESSEANGLCIPEEVLFIQSERPLTQVTNFLNGKSGEFTIFDVAVEE